MQFINNAPIFKLVRITGPKHNLLILQFAKTSIEGPVRVETLDAEPNCSAAIEPSEVLDNALKAISDFEAETGKRYFLEVIQYVSSDSRPVDIYYDMTKEIIRRIEAQ